MTSENQAGTEEWQAGGGGFPAQWHEEQTALSARMGCPVRQRAPQHQKYASRGALTA